ncbi:MAG: aspartate aminotransferase family protein [Planctomycetota bacterium]|nr:aspartate aminotransferase family protein [Planctomycetota bacterium]
MFDLKALLGDQPAQSLDLIEEHVNPQFAKVLRIIGYDVRYVRGQAQYLYDDQGNRYIDCLAGYGTFACGRNHPVIRDALKQAMDMDLPNLPKMGAYRLSGLLARELIKVAPPGLDTVFFTNCGAMGVETAIKYARAATKRSRIVFCKKGFHGLSVGALGVNGNEEFREGFGPLGLACTAIPFNDLAALEAELAKGDVAGFIVEPIQGKGVNIPSDDYLPGVAALCKKHGTVYIDDEVQTGYGRTGKMWACQHWNVEPDIMITAKALSGGYVPVGAVLAKRSIHNAVFSSLDRCVVHSTTFGQNDLAMAAGLATLHVLREERIVENSQAVGTLLRDKLQALVPKYELLKEVRGKGLMIAVEFGPPKSMMLRAQWNMLHSIDASLFPQAILIPLLKDHHVLAQVAGHHLDVIKLIPSLVLNPQDVDHLVNAFDQVIASCSRLTGPMWEVGKRLSAQALKRTTQGAGAS